MSAKTIAGALAGMLTNPGKFPELAAPDGYSFLTHLIPNLAFNGAMRFNRQKLRTIIAQLKESIPAHGDGVDSFLSKDYLGEREGWVTLISSDRSAIISVKGHDRLYDDRTSFYDICISIMFKYHQHDGDES